MRPLLVMLFFAFPLVLQAKSPETAPAAPALNEIAGRIQSIDLEAKTFRILTEGGYNVTFSYTRDTVLKGIGVPKVITDLQYEELVTVRYPGKDLYAAEVEKRSLAAVR